MKEFLKDCDGKMSSKRLISLSTALVFCILSCIGAGVFLFKGEYKDFLDLIETIALLSGGGATVSVAEKMMRREKSKSDANLT